MSDKPLVDSTPTTFKLTPMLSTIVFRVVNSEETGVGFSATLANFPISFHYEEFLGSMVGLIINSRQNLTSALLAISTRPPLYCGFVCLTVFTPSRQHFNSVLCPVGSIVGASIPSFSRTHRTIRLARFRARFKRAIGESVSAVSVARPEDTKPCVIGLPFGLRVRDSKSSNGSG
ncbi:hypothetical protein LCGC14_2898380 [marine sediment metagenome]|uniref:Uncharacterized protein n=1 Tax=marine sediment metagenome TaxID=412755 RepID=A0A0F9ALC3_9ZZZZ